MRQLACLALLGALLSGCAGQPASPDGVWINQPIIEAARQGGSLREALLAYGPNLEWQVDSQRGLATYSNGFELGEGQLVALEPGHWRVDYHGDFHELLSLSGEQLHQQASDNGPEQHFSHPAQPAAADAPPGSSFEWALYDAYLGGTWKIREGVGQGGLVLFHPDGSLEGFPGAERYALCLAGDCAAMSGEHDSLWLQLGQQGNTWIFERDGDQLLIREALNRAQPDEMPDFQPGRQVWLLERD
ncbi:hypothetical protein A9179_21625 [Pseudomonas alcaligenes]|uniref:Lipoprotein n=1 Tax=Aquipseudomonas alcaligenes TaxID=43263 RepID=A0ABR7S8S6_AQUAC|nr:hypothetical protein [Pseudomonas alcaligenes]MBC9252873.1 hypothetical protein [Pseudomonas alcaligenes]